MKDEDLTKVSFNANSKSMTALETAADNAGLNRTDTLNRAVQIYAMVTTSSLWHAFAVLMAERSNVRRFAAERDNIDITNG
jgi:hypothetical protein